MTQLPNAAVQRFRTEFAGQVVTAADPDYDAARAVWNGDVDHRPVLVARCTGPTDVAAALRFARVQGLEVSVRGGAHSFSGAAVVDDALVVDLSGLRTVTVDPETRRAVAGGGVTGAELDVATQEHGLAVTMGTISHTGVAGLTLGGGFGWLTYSMGLSCDNLASAEVVLADGRVVRASAQAHPDLYWGLRGGGGNFGVVTEFEYRLAPVGPEVHLGLFFWELDRRGEALRAARDLLETLPHAAGGLIAAGVTAPPAPFVPDQYHHLPGCAALVAGFGTAAEHAALVAPLREAPKPLFEFLTPMPYTALQQLLDDSAPWGVPAYEKALHLDELTDEAIGVIAKRLLAKSSPMSFLPIFPLGGAFAEVADDATAFGGSRSSRWVVNIAAMAPTPELLVGERQWARELWADLLPYARDPGGYVNFMSEFDQDRIRAAYGPAKYARLAEIKRLYDPTNLFRPNANIKPSPV